MQRKGSITAKDFLSLCIFYGDDICKSSLSKLASKYDALFDTEIFKQGLDKCFNKNTVEFLKAIFEMIMTIQNEIGLKFSIS